jgi:hypothetical protein
LIHEIDSIPKGHRTCGGYEPAEVWLMELAWLEAVAAAVLLVLKRIGLIDCRRSTVNVEIDQSSPAEQAGMEVSVDISGVQSGRK